MVGASLASTDEAPPKKYKPFGRCVVEYATGRIVATATGLGLDATQICDALNVQERE